MVHSPEENGGGFSADTFPPVSFTFWVWGVAATIAGRGSCFGSFSSQKMKENRNHRGTRTTQLPSRWATCAFLGCFQNGLSWQKRDTRKRTNWKCCRFWCHWWMFLGFCGLSETTEIDLDMNMIWTHEKEPLWLKSWQKLIWASDITYSIAVHTYKKRIKMFSVSASRHRNCWWKTNWDLRQGKWTDGPRSELFWQRQILGRSAQDCDCWVWGNLVGEKAVDLWVFAANRLRRQRKRGENFTKCHYFPPFRVWVSQWRTGVDSGGRGKWKVIPNLEILEANRIKSLSGKGKTFSVFFWKMLWFRGVKTGVFSISRTWVTLTEGSKRKKVTVTFVFF